MQNQTPQSNPIQQPDSFVAFEVEKCDAEHGVSRRPYFSRAAASAAAADVEHESAKLKDRVRCAENMRRSAEESADRAAAAAAALQAELEQSRRETAGLHREVAKLKEAVVAATAATDALKDDLRAQREAAAAANAGIFEARSAVQKAEHEERLARAAAVGIVFFSLFSFRLDGPMHEKTANKARRS